MGKLLLAEVESGFNIITNLYVKNILKKEKKKKHKIYSTELQKAIVRTCW